MGLAAFGAKVTPVALTQESKVVDCGSIGHLAAQMISGEASEESGKTILSMLSNGYRLDIRALKPSALFMDFLELCFGERGDIIKIANVSPTLDHDIDLADGMNSTHICRSQNKSSVR